jgi:hypothetical protein
MTFTKVWMWDEQWEEAALARYSLLLHDLQQLKELIKLVLYDTLEHVLLYGHCNCIKKLQLEALECLVLMHSIKLRLDWIAYRIEKQEQYKKHLKKSDELKEVNEAYRNKIAVDKLKLTLQNLHDCLNDALNCTSEISKIEIGDYKEVKELLNITQKALTEISNYLDKSFT